MCAGPRRGSACTLLLAPCLRLTRRARCREGKLRYLYECGPMGFIVEQAGGRATTGKVDILEIVPTGLHMRAPIFLGSRLDVNDIDAAFAEYTPTSK